MLNYKEELKRITNVLLEPEDDYKKLYDTIDELSKLFTKVTDLDVDKEENRGDIYLSTGKAIGTVWAAMCVKEILRTKRFLRGLFLAIKASLVKFPSRPIHILYAGTGPFATLAIPMTTLFTSDEINFTFLEINEKSINLLEKVIKTFEVERYIKNIVKCDATTYKVDKSSPVHILLTETMNNALQKEPQVAITMNLAPQIIEGGILIPQNIIIEAGLLNYKKNMERMLNGYTDKYYHSIKNIFELNQASIHDYFMEDNGTNEYSFPEVEIEIPRDIVDEGYKQLNLFTTIHIFEGEILTNWQCSLNLPQKIMNFDCEDNFVERLRFRYESNNKPGFHYSV